VKTDTKAKIALAGAGVLAAVFVLRRAKRVITEDLNPASDRNVINRGVTAVVQDTTGGRFKDLGHLLFCYNPFDSRRNPVVCPNLRQDEPSPPDPAAVKEDVRALGSSGTFPHPPDF